jgi:predicted O-methyltransferase YrrM
MIELTRPFEIAAAEQPWMPETSYETRLVVGRSGEVHHLHSEINHEEGILLFNTIRDDLSIVKTLEVGCGFGLSSLHICKALQSRTRASIIDPFQTDWNSVGVKNLEEAGIRFFNLVEVKSEFALPRIRRKHVPYL